MASKSHKHNLLPLLYFGTGCVEWIPHPGMEDCGYSRDETLSRSPQDMVRVARGLAHESGIKPGRCVVLLGGEQVRQRIFSLGDIPSKEVRSVLRRKAANLLEVEEHQAVFTALPLATHDGETDFRWMISAIRLEDLRSIQRNLLRDGFRPRRFLFARQAMLRTAGSYLSTGSDDEAWVIVGLEDNGVAISLVAADKLVQQSFVPGAFSAQSAMAASVLQEMRGFESYWRRFSRGGAIDDVFVAGLTHQDAEHFELACHAALPNAEFLSVGGDEGTGAEEARAAYLSTCAAGEGPEGDMTLPVPIGKRWMASAAALALAIGLGTGRMVQANLDSNSNTMLGTADALASEVPELPAIEHDLELLETRESEWGTRHALASQVGLAGVELGEWMQLVQQALDGPAQLEALHLDDGGGELAFSITASVEEEPSISTPALAEINRILGEDGRLTRVKLRLPTTLGSGSNQRPGMEFRVTGAIAEFEEEVQ